MVRRMAPPRNICPPKKVMVCMMLVMRGERKR